MLVFIPFLFVLVSVVLAIVDHGWRNPILWVLWAFSWIYIVVPALSRLG